MKRVIPEPKEIIKLLHSYDFTCKIPAIAVITSRKKEAGLEITRKYGHDQYFFTEVKEGKEKEAPTIFIPEDHYYVIRVHSHTESLHGKIVSPSPGDVMFDNDYYVGVAGFVENNLGLVIFNSERNNNNGDLFNILREKLENPLKLFQTQDEVIDLLGQYYSFADFIKYKL